MTTAGGARLRLALGREGQQREKGQSRREYERKQPESVKNNHQITDRLNVCARSDIKFNYTSIMSLKGHSSLIFFLNEKRATHPMLPNLRSCFGPLQKTDFGGVG